MDIKHWIFEEDESPPSKAAPIIKPHNLGVTTREAVVGSVPVPAVPTPTVNGQKAYQKLAAKINFESTSYGADFLRYLQPLLGLQMDERSKYKAALAQASAQEGLTVEKILATFDGLKTSLQTEVQHFEETASNMESGDLADKKKRLADLDNQIAALQSEKNGLATDVNTSTQKISRAREEFKAAAAELSSQLDIEKTRYTNLLKG